MKGTGAGGKGKREKERRMSFVLTSRLVEFRCSEENRNVELKSWRTLIRFLTVLCHDAKRVSFLPLPFPSPEEDIIFESENAGKVISQEYTWPRGRVYFCSFKDTWQRVPDTFGRDISAKASSPNRSRRILLGGIYRSEDAIDRGIFRFRQIQFNA